VRASAQSATRWRRSRPTWWSQPRPATTRGAVDRSNCGPSSRRASNDFGPTRSPSTTFIESTSGCPLEESLSVLREYRDSGRIRHVGVSEVSVDQIERARAVVPIAAVQNEYNLSERKYDYEVDFCERENIPFVPFFPLRGVVRAPVDEIASRYDATSEQIILAWLLKRSPMIVPIPGTLSLEHLKTNLAVLDLELSDEDYARLNGD
jgi:aryl-alcohol dehydrogenase-like predicted oxidoreductase